MPEAIAPEAIDNDAWAIFKRLISDEEAKQNPQLCYAQLHELGDHFRMPDGTTIVVSHAGVSEILRSPHFIRGVVPGTRYRPAYAKTTPEQDQELFELGSKGGAQLTVIDPPDHTRIRAQVQKAFMPRFVRALENIIPQEIDRLLGAVDPKIPVDVVADFSAKFAPQIMAHLIGLPADRRAEVSKLSAVFMRGVDPGCDFEMRRASVLAEGAKCDIIREVIADRRLNPRDDLVSTLIAAVPDELSERELVALLHVMYLGGYETTSHMVGNGLVLLMQNPDQFAALVADPSLVGGAVDEILRLKGAIALTKVIAAEGASFLGKTANPGDIYLGLLGAANRDPEIYPDPDRFDIRRKGRPHLSFGGGIHFCLGVNLARFELERVFMTFATRYPHMRLVDPDPRRLSSFMQCAHERVMVLLDP